MPLNTAALNPLPLELGSHGSAVNNTVRQLAGAVGTAVIVTIFSLQTTAHMNTQRLAPILGANDTYEFMFILSIIALVLILFVPKEVKHKKRLG